MHATKFIYFITTLLITIPFDVFTMEFGHQELALQHTQPLELTQEVTYAVREFLHENHLSQADCPAMAFNNNLFLQTHEALNTAVAVFTMPNVFQVAPINNQEANRACSLFRVYKLPEYKNGMWSVMFDYANRKLLPVTSTQAAFLLIAPYLKEMPRTDEVISRPFLTQDQQQEISAALLPEHRNACKQEIEDGTLIEIFKIEQSSNKQKESVQSTQAIALFNRILCKYRQNDPTQVTISKELTTVLNQIWELRDREGFAVGTIVQTDSECKQIEEIQINDLVAAKDLKTDTQTLNRVVNICKEQIPTYFQIIFDNRTINVAPDQPLYLPGLAKYVTAFELSQSQELQNFVPGSILEINQINEPIEVYKLTVENDHNFYVDDNLLAHNHTPSPVYSISTSNFASKNENLHLRVEYSTQAPMLLTHQQQLYIHQQKHKEIETRTLEQQTLLVSRKEVRKNFITQLPKVHSILTESRGLQAVYQAYGIGNCDRLEKRNALIKEAESQTRKWHFSSQKYELSKNATELLHHAKAQPAIFKTCYGNPLQQFIHQDCISIVEKTSALTPNSILYDQRSCLVDLTEAACAYNRAGETTKAIHLTDLCHALLDHGKAIAEGAALGALGVVEYALDHPIETALCIVASEYVLAYHLGKVLVEVADIGIDMLTRPEEGTKKWNEFIAPVTQVISILEGKTKINSRDICKFGACALVSWKAQGKLNRGLGKLYSGAKTKAVAFAKNSSSATPQQYMSTPEGLLFKSIKESTNQPNANNGILNTIVKREQVLPKVKTYEQARNLALKIIGKVDPHSGKPHIGTVGVGEGKIVGRRWHGKKVIMRLDYDPIKGPHVNVTDFRTGKGIDGISVAIPFEGDLQTVKQLLKYLGK